MNINAKIYGCISKLSSASEGGGAKPLTSWPGTLPLDPTGAQHSPPHWSHICLWPCPLTKWCPPDIYCKCFTCCFQHPWCHLSHCLSSVHTNPNQCIHLIHHPHFRSLVVAVLLVLLPFQARPSSLYVWVSHWWHLAMKMMCHWTYWNQSNNKLNQH